MTVFFREYVKRKTVQKVLIVSSEKLLTFVKKFSNLWFGIKTDTSLGEASI